MGRLTRTGSPLDAQRAASSRSWTSIEAVARFASGAARPTLDIPRRHRREPFVAPNHVVRSPCWGAGASWASDPALVRRPADKELADMPRDPREGVLASAASSLLGHEHVLARAIDDSVSKEAFHHLIDDLDVGKVFLLEGDVQRLSRFETDMDDELRTGDLVLGRKAAALLASRRRVVADVIARTLAAPLDFTANESIETDPKKRVFCKTEEELAARWRSVLKLQVLERTQELEDTRLATQFTRLASVDKLAPAQTFINVVNGAFDPHTTHLPPAEEASSASRSQVASRALAPRCASRSTTSSSTISCRAAPPGTCAPS
jgi:hypothetical protein